MKKNPFCLSILLILFACNSKTDAPDVSGIGIDLATLRFERDFFSIDTSNLPVSLMGLQSKYPGFAEDFLENILGIPIADTNPDAAFAIKKFIVDYAAVRDSTTRIFDGFEQQEKEIRRGLQFVKYYFPEYPTPEKLITFIGPLDAYFQASTSGYGDIITPDGLGIGLQLHMGRKSSFYTSELGRQLYPQYISRRFEPNYIPVNCMKNIIDDIFPDQSVGKPLVEQMIDKGKRLYVLDRLIPLTHDTLKLGYTADQLKGCISNEGLIWNFFVENNLLYEADPMKIKSFVNDAPKTAELGDESPGFISLFIGRQIVKAYMEKFPETRLQDLLRLEAGKIFADSKYKPR